MKKIILVLVFTLFLVACSNNNQQEEINNYVKNNSYASIINKIDLMITNISMFPTEEAENEFIYYVRAIKENIDKFDDDEKNEIYNKLLINYNFEYNSLNYTLKDYQNDLIVISK